MPDDVHRSFAPRHPAEAEWFDAHDAEITLPGNGRPRLLDVVVVLDRPYPHAFEWTQHSRAAGLAGYAIKAVPFDVKVEVFGMDARGEPLSLSDMLTVECRDGMIRADWAGRSVDQATNWVPWTGENI
jgi:hypothetical protein